MMRAKGGPKYEFEKSQEVFRAFVEAVLLIIEYSTRVELLVSYKLLHRA